jgi:hypothetical protein
MTTVETDTPTPTPKRGVPLPVKASDYYPFTPARYGQEGALPADAPVYLLRYPGPYDVPLWRADTTRAGLVHVSQEDLHATLEEYVNDAAARGELDDETQSRSLEAIDTLRTLDPATVREDMSEADRHAILEATMIVGALEQSAIAEHPPYANLMYRRERWLGLAPVIAASYWLQGVTTVEDAQFERVRSFKRGGNYRVLESELRTIEQTDLVACGLKALGLRTVPEAQKKS